ncbi:MAG: ABC transporter permease [Gemmatimonadales bacterium]
MEPILSFLNAFLRHARAALRPLWRRPAFALTAIVSLGVGIGANATVLSVVNALLLRPLPYAEPERLVAIWPNQTFANQELAAIRERARSYDLIAAYSPGWLMAIVDVASPRQLSASRVSGNFLAMLGATPLIGRLFGMEAEAPGSDLVAVLSYDLWRTTFRAESSVVGRSVVLDGRAYTVVGVMPRGFQAFGAGTDLWTPLTMDRNAMTWSGATSLMYGRLRRGTTTTQASAELGPLASAMQSEFSREPAWARGTRVVGLQENMIGGVKATLFVLLAAVAFLLLIAVANVANLLLVRTSERRQELAVRTSLGATPAQVAALLLGESVTLGIAGGMLGVLLAFVGVALLRGILPANLPRLDEIAVDARVLGAASAITLVAAVLSGVLPALAGLGTGATTRLRSGRNIAGSGGRARGVLVAAEVALALVLTIGAIIMGRTLMSLQEVDRGLRTDHLLTMRVQPAAASSEEYRTYWRQVFAQVRAVPGVTAVATILHLPTSGRNWQAGIEIEGRPLAPGASLPRAGWQSVSDGYFAAAGMPILEGRGFGAGDDASAPLVLVLNSVLAQSLFPGESPVGKRVKAGNATAQQWATVVGVVSSVRHDSLNAPPSPELYAPFDQRVVVANSLVIRTKSDPAVLEPATRERIWSVKRNVPISDVRTMDDLYSASLQRQRMILVLFMLFAGAGLLLSAVGIYGVVAYGVRQRMHEIGIRVALGAGEGSIRRLVIAQGLRHALAGVAAGLAAAFALSGFMRTLVFGVPARDPVSFTLVTVVLVLVAVTASWIPARRAARVDPNEVLRR